MVYGGDGGGSVPALCNCCGGGDGKSGELLGVAAVGGGAGSNRRARARVLASSFSFFLCLRRCGPRGLISLSVSTFRPLPPRPSTRRSRFVPVPRGITAIAVRSFEQRRVRVTNPAAVVVVVVSVVFAGFSLALFPSVCIPLSPPPPLPPEGSPGKKKGKRNRRRKKI